MAHPLRSRRFIERGFTEIIAQVGGADPPSQASQARLLAENVLPEVKR
jgi:hypothetical protein